MIETLLRFLDNPTRQNVIDTTEAFKALIDTLWTDDTALGKEMQRHLLFVTNRILVNTKQHGYSRENLEKSGKMLFRLIKIWGAYRKKSENQNLNRQEWLDKFTNLAKEVKAMFD